MKLTDAQRDTINHVTAHGGTMEAYLMSRGLYGVSHDGPDITYDELCDLEDAHLITIDYSHPADDTLRVIVR